MNQRITVPSGQANKIAAPKFLFRYFDQEEHAERLLQGLVWVSTFEWCRKCDDFRQDQDEGRAIWSPPDFDQSDDPDRAAAVMQALQMHGLVKFGSAVKGLVMTGTKVINEVTDGFLFCTSLSDSLSSFGRYRVRISEPIDFFEALTASIHAACNIAYESFGPVHYDERIWKGLEPYSGNPAFLCPPGNRREQELRMYWRPVNPTRIQRMEVSAPGAAKYCSRDW